MKPQINLRFLQTHDSTIYVNDNVSKFFPSGRRRWGEFKRFFYIYDPRTDPNYDAAKYSLFKVCGMLQHLQRNFELYWDPERYLSIGEQTIEFQGRHKDKLWITFKDASNSFKADAMCDRGYT